MSLGLALAGGGLKGLAHIGALKALEELGIKLKQGKYMKEIKKDIDVVVIFKRVNKKVNKQYFSMP